jgi:hypothetical protein
MTHRKTVSLNLLAQSRESEIEGMLVGIQGKPGSVLWTAELRATTRGGADKTLGIPMIEQASQS